MKGNTHMDHRKARKIYWLFLLAGSIVIVLTAFATDEILQKIIIGAGVGVWIIGFIVAFYPVSVLQRSIKFERPVTRLLSALWEKDMIKYLLEYKKLY